MQVKFDPPTATFYFVTFFKTSYSTKSNVIDRTPNISVNFTGIIFLFYERKSKRWVKYEKETFIYIYNS